MLSVLKMTPGVEGARLGVSRSHKSSYPFLEYRFSDKSGQTATIRFNGGNLSQKAFDMPAGAYMFTTVLSGSGLHQSDWGTSNIERQWKMQCGANAVTLWE